MDSGNSGSMNSSSGEEEYDSRTDQSIPSFLNPSLTHFGSSDPNPPDPSQLLSHHLFDLQPNPSNPNNFLLNLDTAVRSRSALMRSDHQHQHQQPYQLGLMSNNPQSSSMSNIQQPLMFPTSSAIQLQPSQLPNETVTTTSTTTNTSSAALRSAAAAAAAAAGGSSSQTGVVRSSKKRTRASRRAPTTVLTTDTSNFRAMVQEFTGIPAPPFSASSPFARRLDLFGSGSSGIRSGGGAHLDGPLYPLIRPSAIKPQTSPFSSVPSPSSSSSSMFSNVMVDATNIATSSMNFPPPSSSSDHHHHHHHHQGLMMNKQPMRNVLNMQSHGQTLNMAFQGQSLPLHPNTATDSLNAVAGFGTNSKQNHQPNLDLDHHHQDVNAGHGYPGPGGSGLPNAAMRRDELWRVEGAAASGDISCKMNYVATAAAAPPPPNSAEINSSSRGEGTVDSWIFQSD